MREAVICEPVRTAVGRYGGVFRDVPAAVLAATVIGELMRRTGIDAGAVDDVLFPQRRSSWYPVTSTGNPASRAATRPMAGASPLG